MASTSRSRFESGRGTGVQTVGTVGKGFITAKIFTSTIGVGDISKLPASSQLPTSGLGRLYTSPRKRFDKYKSQTFVAPLGHEAKRRRLEAQFQALLKESDEESSKVCESDALTENPPAPGGALDTNNDDMGTPLFSPPSPLPSTVDATPAGLRATLPGKAAHNVYNKWNEILPALVDPLLSFITETFGKITHQVTALETSCVDRFCVRKSGTILCLFQNYFEKISLVSCECQDPLHILVSNGLFPTSPTYPRMAVSIFLLEFYHALFERSCDAVNALAHALSTFYTRRGFVPLNQKGQPIPDAFRRGLGYAIQWYDNLRMRLDRRVETALQEADSMAQDLLRTSGSDGDRKPEPDGTSPDPNSLFPGECAQVLRQRCPLCFGGRLFGRSLEEGGDFEISTDGNFNHRHHRSAGDCPQFYQPEYFLPKVQVDAVGLRIASLRKRTPKHPKPLVPDDAIDECASSHTAGSGSNTKTNMDKFDDGGVMALVCRHDIPLFFANIDTPGEQQKYAVTLVEHFFSLIPPQATTGILYDVGCVLDRTLQNFDILPDDITKRIVFATTAMHAYAHQWACQLVYNPRIRQGFGLTDGEGTERLWSRMRKLIGVRATSARVRLSGNRLEEVGF